MEKTELGIKAPRFWLFRPEVEFYLTLPDGRQIGPNSLTGGIKINGLPPGEYQLSGQFEGHDPFSLHITLSPGTPIVFQPMKGVSLAARRAFRRVQGRDGKATILYLQRRMRHAAYFWLGHAESEKRLAELLATGGDHRFQDGGGVICPATSEFAASQHQHSYDPDCLEAGFEPGGSEIPSRFAAYSWAAEWAPELAFRASGQHPGYRPVKGRAQNCLVMVGGDPGRIAEWRMNECFDVERPGIELRYMGLIEFTYFDGGPPGR